MLPAQRALRARRDLDRGVEKSVTFLAPSVEPELVWAAAKEESSRRIGPDFGLASRSRPPYLWNPLFAPSFGAAV
jgi:hypothetical protein